MRGLLSDISGHLKEKNVSKSRQHGLINGKSCLSKAVVTVRKALRFPVTMEISQMLVQSEQLQLSCPAPGCVAQMQGYLTGIPKQP